MPRDEIDAKIVEVRRGDAVLLADGYQASFARIFDGIHTYNICDWVLDNPPKTVARLAAATTGPAARRSAFSPR